MSVPFHEDEILGAAYDARLMRRLLRYVRPYGTTVALSVVLLLLTSAATLVGPSILHPGGSRGSTWSFWPTWAR